MARYIKMTKNRKQRWCYLTDFENSNWKFYDLLLWLFFVLKFICKFIAYGYAHHEASTFMFLRHISVLEFSIFYEVNTDCKRIRAQGLVYKRQH